MNFPREPQRLRDGSSPLGKLLKTHSEISEPDFAKQRVWQRVSSQLNAPSKLKLPLLGLASMALGALLVLGLTGRLSFSNGDAAYTVLLAARDSQLIDRVGKTFTPSAGTADLHFQSFNSGTGALVLRNEAVTVVAMANTQVTQTGAHAFTLGQGRLALSTMGEVTVTVSPTTLTFLQASAAVAVSAEGQLTIMVEEGSVMLRSPRETVELRAGQQWPTATTSPALKETLNALALMKSPTARLQVQASGPVTVDGVALGEPPIDAQMHIGGHTVEALGIQQRVDVVAEKTTRLDVSTPRQMIEEARQLQKTGNVAGAVEAYSRATSTTGSSGEIALYERGLLRRRSLHDASGALSDFDEYRRRFPDGSLSAEVSLTRMEVLLELNRHELALKQMSEFLDAFPDSERGAEVHLMRGEVLRSQGACGSALSDFAEAKRDPRWADDATWFAAQCDGSSSATRNYLNSFPSGVHSADARALLQKDVK